MTADEIDKQIETAKDIAQLAQIAGLYQFMRKEFASLSLEHAAGYAIALETIRHQIDIKQAEVSKHFGDKSNDVITPFLERLKNGDLDRPTSLPPKYEGRL